MSFDRWAKRTGSLRTATLLARCHGLMADGAEATEAFESALRLGASSRCPTTRPGTSCHGRAPATRGARIDARTHLRAALDAFETLGATLWRTAPAPSCAPAARRPAAASAPRDGR